MLLSTSGLVLHTTPYSESSVVVKVFTRQLGLRSYIIKGVRGRGGRVKQNLLQPLSSLDMVVYDNPRTELNYIKELSPRNPSDVLSSHSLSLPLTPSHSPIENALRFFMTEVLYKALREAEPMPALFDYIDEINTQTLTQSSNQAISHLPISFLLTVARHLGIEPLDNYSSREPLFDLQEGRFVSAPTETTLSPDLSALLHQYLSSFHSLSLPLTPFLSSLDDRTALINALLNYYHLHLSGFSHFHSHEILHTILK
jgi:DNA repair protein RecO (recombination protein O)